MKDDALRARTTLALQAKTSLAPLAMTQAMQSAFVISIQFSIVSVVFRFPPLLAKLCVVAPKVRRHNERSECRPSAKRVVLHPALQRWMLLVPLSGKLILMRHIQHARFVEIVADNVHAHKLPGVFVDATRMTHRGLPG